MASTSETGLQLFARLISRPSLLGLDNVLFPDGPNAKEVIELSGEPSCGKTLLFSQFIVKCILPKEVGSVRVGGLSTGVVLLNTDHHFQMYKMVSLMEAHLKAASEKFSVSDVENIVKDSLDRLVMYNISDSAQLQVTFHALHGVVANQPEIGLILLDSICAFYWQDSMASGIRKMDLYAKNVLKMMQKTLSDFKGVIMYSRPDYFQSKSGKAERCSSDLTVGCVNRKIILKRTVQENIFNATIETAAGQEVKLYTIDPAGIHWVKT
ncbi:DNA repair protein XRCC2-like [Homalodisca vitripennis]|uniref:DNA repair protein XRCC2-like n=1 Tax=Homalodisca vitripennis TaxID=197043 RepID=UPI001EEB716F|nr:DNA repair protein XRCC2-like [Homalodisca vitripennis]